MASSRSRSLDTSFASAARAAGSTLEAQRRAFLADPNAAALLDAMPGPSMLLNANRQIVGVNGVLRTALGVDDPESLLGLRPGEALQCVHSDERPGGCGTTRACSKCGAVAAVLECLATGRRVTRECRISTRARRDGGALDLRVHASAIEVGGESFVLVGIEDIGSEKRREVLERVFLREMLGTCLELHDIAERLDPALGGEAAGAPASAAPDEHRDLHRLTGVALDLILRQRQLLAAERGELEVIPCRVDLADLLRDMVRTLQEHPAANGRSIRLEHTRRCTLRTDPAVLERALSDLVRNALEATPAGGTVSVSCETDHRSATLSIHNDGVIPEDVQLQIFQRSFTTREAEGRGIGTYGAKLIVERYLGGHVEFASDERVGTLFVVVVPDMGVVGSGPR